MRNWQNKLKLICRLSFRKDARLDGFLCVRHLRIRSKRAHFWRQIHLMHLGNNHADQETQLRV